MTRAQEGEQSTRLLGVALVIAGSLLVLASFRFLDWYDVPAGAADSAGTITFGKLRTSADQLGGAGITNAYFDWLAWVLLIGVIVVGVAANMATPYADPLRVAGFGLGLLGVAGTCFALVQHFHATGSRHGIFHNASWGVWATLVGFLLGAVGAVLGPGSRR